MDLSTAEDTLYGLPLGEFTAARDASATEARKAGNIELAVAIKALRKPTTVAWLANVLVRERRDQVAELLDLGAALRRAQEELAVDELRQLSQQRHKAVSDLRNEAQGLAGGAGQPVSGSVLVELETTLEAALADAEAADALKSGHLTTGLRYSGLGWAGAPPPSSTSESLEHLVRCGRFNATRGTRAGQDGARRCSKAALRGRRGEGGRPGGRAGGAGGRSVGGGGEA